VTLPDLTACPNCGRSIRVRPKNCPGCGFAIRAYRVKVKIGDRVKVIERVVAIPPEHVDKFTYNAGELVEDVTKPGGLTEDPTPGKSS